MTPESQSTGLKGDQATRDAVVEQRRTYLSSLGFSDKGIERISSKYSKTLITPEVIDAKIAGLKERNFKNPHKMIESLPHTLGYTFDNIDAKIAGLKERNFNNPHKMIESSPSILGYTFNNIDAKIAGLTERNFNNPHKMIESLPHILGYSFDNIDAKIAGLKERNFKNPHKMIETFPPVLSLAFDNIDAKIAGLKERNFNNPHKMIESSPNILSLAFNNIDRRLRLLNGLVNLYQLPYSSVEMMERGNFMFSTKIDKLLVLARVLKEYQVSEDDLPKTAIKLIFINLENVLVALSQAEEKDDINALFKRITEIKTQDLDRQQKREIIREELDKFPKIVRRYLKGYPN